MILDLRQIYDVVGESLDIDYTVNDEDILRPQGISFPGGVAVKALVSNRAGIVSLTGSAVAVLKAPCDRCLRIFERELSCELDYILVRSVNSEDNDEFIVTPGDTLDLDELVSSDILLNIPAKLLCSEDCKGLCPHCGADLNISPCDCAERQ